VSIPLLSGVGDALDYYQRSVSDPVSGSILLALNKAKMGLGLGDQGSQQMSDQFGSGAPGSDPSGALNFAYHDNPLGRFAFQTATDPLNLVGMGIPGHLAETGLAHAIPGAVGLLDKASWLDQAPGALAGQAGNIAGKFIGAPIVKAADSLSGPVADFAAANKRLSQGWSNANMGWKALQHLTPGPIVRDIFDDTTRMGANGEWGSMADSIGGMFGRPTAGDRWASTFGDTVPASVGETGLPPGGSILHNLQDQVPELNDIGNPVFDQYGNQSIVPSTSGIKNALVGKLGDWSDTMRNTEQGLDIQRRGAVYGNAAFNSLDNQVAPGFANYLDKHWGSNASGAFSDTAGRINPADLEALLAKGGMAPGDASHVSGEWNTALDTARGAAADRTNQVMMDFSAHPWDKAKEALSGAGITDINGQGGLLSTAGKSNLRQIDSADLTSYMRQMGLASTPESDSLLREWSGLAQHAGGDQLLRSIGQNMFGSYKFGPQNLAALGRLSLEHPIVANAPAEYYRDSDIYGAQHGLPASMHGSMPFGNNPFNGEQIMFNPGDLSSLSSLIGAATDQSSAGSGTGVVGGMADALNTVGMGLNPAIQLGLQAAGQNGTNQMSDLIRPLTAVSGLAGLATGRPQNIEGPLKNAVGTAQQAITGSETFPYQDYLVRTRQAELAGGYNKWDATQQSGPLHDAANADESHRIAVQDFLKTMLPLDLQSVPREQQAIGNNQFQSQLYGLHGMPTAASQNPTGQAYALADPLAEKVARFSTLPFQEQQAMLRDPRALQLLQAQRSLQLHNPQSLTVG
jgi:hypothetical protein